MSIGFRFKIASAIRANVPPYDLIHTKSPLSSSGLPMRSPIQSYREHSLDAGQSADADETINEQLLAVGDIWIEALPVHIVLELFLVTFRQGFDIVHHVPIVLGVNQQLATVTKLHGLTLRPRIRNWERQPSDSMSNSR